MTVRTRDLIMQAADELRYEPTEKRIRARLGSDTVLDSTRAMLVWEPRRVVPSYAIPSEDLRVDLVPAEPAPVPDREVLHPGIAFASHSSEGSTFSVGDREAAAFKPADLDDYVVLDFMAFDAWYEEDEEVVAHPRDPFHRVDVRASSRHVRIERDGVLLAESTRPRLLFETYLPVRFYLPREDVTADAQPSARRTRCAYKGEASYLSFDIGGGRRADLAWTYPAPLPDAVSIAGQVAFFDELVDVIVDGELRERPRTLFAASIVEEAGV
jgi:uncharacterized protein (DUF427 family)